MKLLLIFGTLIVGLSLFSQENNQLGDAYIAYRKDNMFSIIQTKDEKVSQYPVLNTIIYQDQKGGEKINLSPEDFITRFKNSQINPLKLEIKRARFGETWYKLGDTDYVLIGYAEDQIAAKYNQTTK